MTIESKTRLPKFETGLRRIFDSDYKEELFTSFIKNRVTELEKLGYDSISGYETIEQSGLSGWTGADIYLVDNPLRRIAQIRRYGTDNLYIQMIGAKAGNQINVTISYDEGRIRQTIMSREDHNHASRFSGWKFLPNTNKMRTMAKKAIFQTPRHAC